ncbi:MAG: hypothetical protein JSV12_09160 [Candidatus Bathyarchaeota archaeon]|nr:MAG: hypothetical protein JSV12_09160 [Candidatus Bathyarchaeota archaeon]
MRILTNKGLIFFLIMFFVFTGASVAKSSYSNLFLNDENGEWGSLNEFAFFEIDELDFVGNHSYKFYTLDATEWMFFGYVFDVSFNLSDKFLVFWLKIQNVTFETPLTLTLDDVNGNERGFWNISSWFALSSNKWARVALDMGNFQWEDPDFDVTHAARMRFGVYDGGRSYSQTVWIENPTLLLEEENKGVSLSNQAGLFLVADILFFLLVFSCTGFIVFHFLKLKLPSGWNFAVALPLYMAVGICVLVVLFSLLCLIYFDAVVSWCVLFAIFATFVVIIRKRLGHLGVEIRSFTRVEFLLPICLFIFSLVRFLLLALDMGWGAYVDSQTHGLFTSLILFHRGFPFSSYPVGNMPLSLIEYPMGFHALSAFGSLVTGSYPGQSILSVGVAMILFLPSLFYSIVYSYTKSLKLSFLAFLLLFFLPGLTPVVWMPSNDLLLGNLLVGTYPNLLGNLILITFLAVIIILEVSAGNSSRQLMLLYGLLIAVLSVSYYPLLPFILGIMFLRGAILYSKRLKLVLGGLLLASIIFAFVLWFYRPILMAFYELDSLFLHSIYRRYSLFELSSPYLVYTALGLIAFPISLWFLFWNKLRNLGLFFLVFFLPLIAAQNEHVYSGFLWFIQPDRVLILLVVFSYVIVLLGIFELSKLNWIRRRLYDSVGLWFEKFSPSFPGWLAVGIVFLLCVPSLVGHVTYSYPARYKEALPHGNDFEALAWLASHVNSSELILNDRTVMGLWASSFRAMSIVNDREIILKIFLFGSLNGTYLANRTIEINKILDYPWDYSGIEEIARKYSVHYIYLSENSLGLSERGQHAWSFPWKHLTQKERTLIYSQNPYLEVTYRSGNAVIFKVKKQVD